MDLFRLYTYSYTVREGDGSTGVNEEAVQMQIIL